MQHQLKTDELPSRRHSHFSNYQRSSNLSSFLSPITNLVVNTSDHDAVPINLPSKIDKPLSYHFQSHCETQSCADDRVHGDDIPLSELCAENARPHVHMNGLFGTTKQIRGETMRIFYTRNQLLEKDWENSVKAMIN